MTTAMSTRRCGFCQCQVPIDSYEHGLSAVCFLIRKWGGVMTRGRAATLGGVPNQPKTPIRCFRIPDELYVAAQVAAAGRGESVSDVVRRALERYVKRNG